MSFEELLDATIELLQRRGRITYRGLKRQFGLSDDFVEDLKEELIHGQRLAVDEGGRVLVWTGGPVSVAPSDRRAITVMFCDLVGSTELSGRLDPEELRELLVDYQQAADRVVSRFGGHVAQLLGDGIVTYFGYPAAHDDDAERAVRAGLGILSALATLNERLAPERGIRLAARVGMHTGLVVISDMGGATHQEKLALGEAPNIAARVQSLGEPNTVLVTEPTQRLVADRFDFRNLGPHAIKGVEATTALYEVVREVPRTFGNEKLEPVFGREEETRLLRQAWERATSGAGRMVVLSGEGGIGKSALLNVLQHEVREQGGRVAHFRCSPYSINTALHPVIESLQIALKIDDGTPPEKLDRLVEHLSSLDLEEAAPYFGTLLSLDPLDRLEPPAKGPAFRARLHDLVVEWMLRQAATAPLLAVFEDVHWADPSTVAVLERLVTEAVGRPLLCASLTRPEPHRPWFDREEVTRVDLTRLDEEAVEALVKVAAGGNPLAPDVLRSVIERTDGVPLFVEEVTKVLVENGFVELVEGTYVATRPAAELDVPASLQSSLMARLDRLGVGKVVAQVGAVIGRRFDRTLLEAVADLEEDDLVEGLAALLRSGLLVQSSEAPHDAYTFKHALVQDAAYDSLLLSKRAPAHARVANVLESRFPDVVANQPELLAHHLTAGARPQRALDYWQRSGARAAERSANAEAVAHLTRAIELLPALPESEHRDTRELDLQIPRAGALRATRGFAAPETGAAFKRARELCLRVGDTQRLIPTLNGLYAYHLVGVEYDPAGEVARELLDLARAESNATTEMIAHRALGAVQFHTGDPRAARDHLQLAVDSYDEEKHADLRFVQGTDHAQTSSCFLALTLWVLGRREEAFERQRWAVAHADKLQHAHSLTQALTFLCMLHTMDRSFAAMPPHAARLRELSVEKALPLMEATASFWEAIADWALRRRIAIADDMERAADEILATGTANYRPFFLSFVAEARAEAGDPDGGLRVLTEARERVESSNERWSDAELHRIEGKLHAAKGDSDAAAVCYGQAIDVARNQNAKMWELRASTALAELSGCVRSRDDVRSMLENVHSSVEGHDVQRARRLVDAPH